MASSINASTTAGVVTTADTSGVLNIQTAGTTAITVDASQNVGVGVTPSAWQSGLRAFQFGATASIYSNGTNTTFYGLNFYTDSGGTNRYLTSNIASAYGQVSGAHQWYTAASGTAGNAITFTQAMTLDASGNLGIGTTSPADMLDVKGNARVGQGQVVATSTVGAVGIYSGITSGSGNAQLKFFGKSVDNTGLTYELGRISGGSFGTYGIDGGLSFSTALNNGSNVLTLSERMRLDASGNLLVGQTTQSNSEKFGVVGSNAGPMIYGRNTSVSGFASQFSCDNASWTGGSVSYFSISGFSPNNTARGFLYASDSTALRFQVYSNGGIANYSANNVNLSDRREKTNFAPATSYLDKICAIPVQTFNYIDQNLEEDAGLTLGVVAQDVQAVAPELVMESDWGTTEEPKMRLSIYQTDLQYALMKCIQEQQALITQLQADVAALKGA